MYRENILIFKLIFHSYKINLNLIKFFYNILKKRYLRNQIEKLHRYKRILKMEHLLTTLTRKQEIDSIIRDTIDKVLVLRFGRASDAVCLQLDDIVCPLSLSYYCLLKI